LLRVIVTALTVAHASDGLPVKAPTSVGMSESRLETIDRLVTRGISAGGYPGAAVVVGRKGAAVWSKGFGHIGWGPDATPVNANRTIYDIASLSKVVGTTSAIMLLYDEKKVDLDAPVFRYLPAFSGGSKDRVTVRQLLTHRSGLPAGRDIWRVARTPQQARDMVLTTPLEYQPDTRYVYSDLGADLLGFIVETVSGQRMDEFLEQRLFQPLGMTDTHYRPADSLRYRIAPTELNPPRGYPLRGEVHDENAYALGGVAGHAGLFSTAADLSIFAQMMLNKGEYEGKHIFTDSTVDLFTRRMSGHRALGWDTADGDFGSGQYLTEKSYGHTGFTGTSLWIDPDREMFVILLTNRVHAATAKRPGKIISDVRSDLSDAAVLAVMDSPQGIAEMPALFRADKEIGWNPVIKPVRAKSRLASRGTVHRSSRVKKGKSAKASSHSSGRTAKKAKAVKAGSKKMSAKSARTAVKAKHSVSAKKRKSK
jgi:serine-type D-Ala-D-Ala carboxypeptidase